MRKGAYGSQGQEAKTSRMEAGSIALKRREAGLWSSSDFNPVLRGPATPESSLRTAAPSVIAPADCGWGEDRCSGGYGAVDSLACNLRTVYRRQIHAAFSSTAGDGSGL